MKVFVAFLALLAVGTYAYPKPDGAVSDIANVVGQASPDVVGAVQGAAGDASAAAGDVMSKIRDFIPPIVQKAFDGFSQAGKDAMKDIFGKAKEARKAGTPFGEDQVMSALKQASPADATLLENAQKDLDAAVAKLSPAVQKVYDLSKTLFGAGKPINGLSQLQPFAQAINDLSDADRNSFFELFPSTKKFFDSPAFKKALSGSS